MNWYRVNLEMRSWTASAWQADTIFGHLCWGMKYLYGEDELATFLEAYRRGLPPLLVSNGFPGDLLPKPIVRPGQMNIAATLQEQRKEFRRNKTTKIIRYLTPLEFSRAIDGGHLWEILSDKVDRLEFETSHVNLKNQINRLTGTTGGEGQLFPFEEFHWKDVSIYLRVRDEFVDKAQKLFDYLAMVGYGKRKSVGYGQVKSHSFQPFDGFPSVPQANGFVTLSNFVPSQKDPTIGDWSMLVKYGKLGEEYALEDIPFKKPLLMLEAGSTFYDMPCREFYGRLVPEVSSLPQVVQYAFALPVPMKITQQ